jgi:hypothetical protein
MYFQIVLYYALFSMKEVDLLLHKDAPAEEALLWRKTACMCNTTLEIGDIVFRCQGLCDFNEKSLMSGKTLKGAFCDKCPSVQFCDCTLQNVAETLGIKITFCNFWGKCQHMPDNQNYQDPKPEEVMKIFDVIIAFAEHAKAM